jgi:hypothetical protein
LNYQFFFLSIASVVVSLSICASALAKSACTNTSKAARAACQHEAGDDFWIAIGNCLNSSDLEARKECKNEANTALKESKKDCAEQYAARKDVCEALGEAPYDPVINPDDFLDKNGIIANPNPYFPLVPGTTKVFEGGGETITVTVTNDTKEILGVTCIVVTDVVEKDGEVIEDTVDWYAQDIYGNVWYFGEISQEFENSELVSLEGSWKAGVDGAKPGILMQANPQVGDVYRQEFSLGNAEDMAEVISVTGSATAPVASCNGDCVVTKDWTPMDPDAVENKYYAPNIGVILEVNPDTGDKVELVDIIL